MTMTGRNLPSRHETVEGGTKSAPSHWLGTMISTSHPFRCAGLVLALGLAACNGTTTAPEASDGQSDVAVQGNAAQGRTTERVANTTAPAAAPIKLAEKSDVLDFKYDVPAEATAIPALRQKLLAHAESDKAKAIKDQADYAADLPADTTPHPFELDTKWHVEGETLQLLVLVAEVYSYIGGAHGSDLYNQLIWDKAAGEEISFDALFTDKAKALATIRKQFCDTLDRERAKRRGGTVGDLGDWSTRCPPFDKYITLAFGHPVGGKFGRVAVYIPADIAGAHAEGSYDFELYIPKAMIGFIKPKWRPSFPG